MRDILFVDGYNVIHAWKKLKYISENINLEAAREKLGDIIGEYAAFTGMKAVVVFDAHMVKGTQDKKIKRPGVTMVYTKEHQTADSYIEKEVSKLDRYQQNIYVATSDGAEQMMILSHGASRISARELLRDIEKKGTELKKIENHSPTSQLGAYLDDKTKDKLRQIMNMRGR
ncbi:MAG: NYN domain-containing protein [Eubacteriales bacterium]